MRRGLRPAAAALVLGGCIVVPTEEHTPRNTRYRGAIPAADAASFQPGWTTREDVLLAIGEPDVVAEGGRRLRYVWSVAYAELVWLPAKSSSDSMELTSGCTLTLEFDGSGTLVRKFEGEEP